MKQASNTPLGIPSMTVQQLQRSKYMRLSPGALNLIKDDMPVGDYLEVLTDRQMYVDALMVLAYAMPIRFAVWWACLCIREIADRKLQVSEQAVWEAAARWVLVPTTARRNALEKPTMACPFDSSLFLLGRSVMFINVELPTAKYTSPVDFPAKGVHGAIRASVVNDPERETEWLQRFLLLGLSVSRGQNLWPTATES